VTDSQLRIDADSPGPRRRSAGIFRVRIIIRREKMPRPTVLLTSVYVGVVHSQGSRGQIVAARKDPEEVRSVVFVTLRIIEYASTGALSRPVKWLACGVQDADDTGLV